MSAPPCSLRGIWNNRFIGLRWDQSLIAPSFERSTTNDELSLRDWFNHKSYLVFVFDSVMPFDIGWQEQRRRMEGRISFGSRMHRADFQSSIVVLNSSETPPLYDHSFSKLEGSLRLGRPDSDIRSGLAERFARMLVNLLRALHSHTYVCVRVYGEFPGIHEMTSGVRQGCSTSPLTFKFVKD